MSRQQFYDVPGGNAVTLDVVAEDGYRTYPFFPTPEETKKNFDNVPNKKCRPDDILLFSYPKTGSHWFGEMVTMLLTKNTEASRGGPPPNGLLEAAPEAAQETLTPPRRMATHLLYKQIPKEAREKKIKAILLCRNPKDTVVSFYNHTKGIPGYGYDGKFENYLEMFMRGDVDFGSYPKYLLAWQQAIRENTDWPIHVCYFEDFKKDTFGEMKRLCSYLDLEVEDELIRKMSENCQIENVKKSHKANETEEQRKQMETIFKDGFRMLRKGQVGNWKNWFTVAQNERFDKWWAENTQGLDMFTFQYT